MTLEIVIVKTENDMETVSALAKEIWTEHFTPIIGEPQVRYMLAKFQSAKAIRAQVSDGWEYYLVNGGGEWIGYTGLIPEPKNGKMMRSKIYVQRAHRRAGVGKRMLNFIENRCIEERIATLWLTVNRFNDETVSWYNRRGFEIVDAVKKDIGNGFFMDDFIMEKCIENR